MLKTFTGVPLDNELWNELALMYPSGAYNKVTGATYLTDVNAGQVIRRLWKVFGPRGVGWGLDIPDSLVGVQQKPIIVKDNEWTRATIPVARFWYLVVDEEREWKATILTSGSSDNKEPGYAIAGAMTSCIKKAVSYLGHQNALYCGIVKHEDIPGFPPDGAFIKEDD